MANELIIKINADAKNAIKAFDDVKKKSEDLTDGLTKAATYAAVAFAALSGEVFLATRAFGENEKASKQLALALQNQGIYTDQLAEDYKKIAEAISDKTGVEDEEIVAAQAITQSYIGQTKITKELTDTIVDFGAKLGSTAQAAELIGKAIGGNVNALSRYKVEFREGATKAEKFTEVIRQLNLQLGGLAEENAKGLGSLKRLGTAFGEVQEKIGSRFAPAIVAVTEALIGLNKYIEKSPKILDFAAAFIAAGIAASGFVIAAAGLATAFTTINAGLAAIGVAGGITVGTFLAIPAAIAAVVAGLVLLALNWETTLNTLKGTAIGLYVTLSEVFGGIKDLLKAPFTDANAGDALKRILDASEKGYAEGQRIVTEGEKKIQEEKKKSEQKQNADKAAAAEKEKQEAKRKEEALLRIRVASDELKLLQLRKASQEEIQLKQEEVQILKSLETEKNAVVIAAANKRIEELKLLEGVTQANELERTRAFEEEKAALKEELAAEGRQGGFDATGEAALNELRAQKQTELDIENQYAVQRLSAKIDADNKFLENQRKFGTAYATIYKAMNSEIYTGTKTAFGELVALQQSTNSTLKAIGKASAIANIIIKTGESAMNIYAGFSTIPIVGPALGLAGAAAAIAFGGEQVSRVTAAASGALVGGSGAGDTQPFMLEPGELVSPRRNFNEVVSGVQTERSGIIDEVRERLTALEGNQGGVNVTIQGDFYGEETMIDKLGAAISDAIQYRNLRFTGVNA